MKKIFLPIYDITDHFRNPKSKGTPFDNPSDDLKTTSRRGFIMKKRLIPIILMAFMFIMCVPNMASAATGGITRSSAVAWIKARGTESWCQDVDGAYGCQCVDLIEAYYMYLGQSRPNGNGYDYCTKTLPSGWTRDHNPTPGSIFACPAYTYSRENGHVGLVYAVDGNTKYTVETNADNGSSAHSYTRNYDCKFRQKKPPFTEF